MKKFLDENFLLNSKTAQKLYHEHAKSMPIIDYHCHLSPQLIAEDHQFQNLTQVWLAGDHCNHGSAHQSAECLVHAGTTCNGFAGSADEVAVKNLSRWPNTDYINIWIVNKINGSTTKYLLRTLAGKNNGEC